MSMIEYKIKRHCDFWGGRNAAPLAAVCRGSYFVSLRYPSAAELLKSKTSIEPEDINVDEFAEDYIKHYSEWEKINDDMFFTAVPFPGLPWMEAMLGCSVYSTGSSFIAVSDHAGFDWDGLGKINNELWLNKFIEFTRMLESLSNGRFPVGQPILRGPADILGTLIGQDNLVYAFYDYPDKTVKALNDLADVFLGVVAEQKKYINEFHGGHSIGFYNLWCPGQCIWFQDDLCALLSPAIYKNYLREVHERISNAYKYSLVHLHPASFFLADYLLGISGLDVIEINKDIGGPSVTEMIPVFKKVQESKKLVIWGDFTKTELILLRASLKPEGLYIMEVVQ